MSKSDFIAAFSEIFTFWDEFFTYGVFPDYAGVGSGSISVSIKLTELG